MSTTSPNALLVFPKFNPNSFWNLQAVCDVWGARCPAPPLGLITLAALLPSSWNFRLVNRNAEELTDADLAWADLVMTRRSRRADRAVRRSVVCRRDDRRVRRREISGRRHQEPDAALRSAQFPALSLYRRAVLPGLPVQLRIL
jgi:hypothetical protein